MNQTKKRGVLYGTALVVMAGLGLAMTSSSAEADVWTLLSSADVQLRLAYGIPATDKQGRELDARSKMITDAEAQLRTAERLVPGMAVTAEFAGFARMLRGDYLEAAACYQRAQACKDCTEEQRDVLAFNQARMLAKGGRHGEALAVFGRNKTTLDARFGHQRELEEATILRGMGRAAEAEQRLDGVVQSQGLEPMAWLQAGVEYAALGVTGKAEQALGRAAADVPIADYHLALLKLGAGDADSCLRLLEHAAKAVPAEVRRKVQDEPDAWRALAGDARFQELTMPRAATPGR